MYLYCMYTCVYLCIYIYGCVRKNPVKGSFNERDQLLGHLSARVFIVSEFIWFYQQLGGGRTPAQGLLTLCWLAAWLAAWLSGWLKKCPKDACKRSPDACMASGLPWASTTS